MALILDGTFCGSIPRRISGRIESAAEEHGLAALLGLSSFVLVVSPGRAATLRWGSRRRRRRSLRGFGRFPPETYGERLAVETRMFPVRSVWRRRAGGARDSLGIVD